MHATAATAPETSTLHGSTLSTTEAADVCRISYRQIDYLTRTARVPVQGRGSGSRTRWPVEIVRVLFVASKVCDVIGDRDIEGGYSRFPAVVERLMAAVDGGLLAAAYGWLVVGDGVVCCTTPEALVEQVRRRGGIVVPLDETLAEFDAALDEIEQYREQRHARLTARGASLAARSCDSCGYRCVAHRPEGGWS